MPAKLAKRKPKWTTKHHVQQLHPHLDPSQLDAPTEYLKIQAS
jgi:hypothetical protein